MQNISQVEWICIIVISVVIVSIFYIYVDDKEFF